MCTNMYRDATIPQARVLVLQKEYSETAELTDNSLKLRPDKPLVWQKSEAIRAHRQPKMAGLRR